jgi:UbiD family decarboxylase
MTIAVQDLREYLDRLVREVGPESVRTIDGAHWDLEIGGISELMAESGSSPALLFDNIPGYPTGSRVLTNYMGTPAACAVAVGLAPDTPKMEVVRVWKDRLRNLTPLPPKDVGDGPILENVLEGDDVDLEIFPTPKWHEQDGGRYIGTACMVITRDPDSGFVNLGTYRACVQGKDRLSLWINANDGRTIASKYWARGQACPISVVVGCEPTLATAAATSAPFGVSEYDLAGAMRGEPVEVLYPPGSDLPVPAFAEIVIEGEMPPVEEESVHEGPFGEWTGYYTHSGPETVVRVRRILHRNDPIILGSPPLLPTTTPGYQGLPIFGATQIWQQLDKAGLTNVVGVWAYGLLLMFVISIKQTAPGQGLRALMAAAGSPHTIGGMQRFFVVVDDDVDITDLNHVLWAVFTRVKPVESIHIIPTMTGPIDPRLSPKDRADKDYLMGTVLIDATKPFFWKDDFPGENRFTETLREEIRAKWSDRLPL